MINERERETAPNILNVYKVYFSTKRFLYIQDDGNNNSKK